MAPDTSYYAELGDDEQSWLQEHRTPFGGKYAVERVIGKGGMGTVFEARHIRLGQRVAIKVLGSSLREYPELVARFEREARACGALSSVHAVRVFDIDATEDGTPFIVMELLAGRDLSSIIERDGAQPVPRAVGWIIEACDAIAEAHRVGIVHRDIKPSNLFLTDVDGGKVVKVLDFGIAKRVSTQEVALTQAVAPLGTPQYMSPEQVRCAKNVDGRTDVWSLGVTLYELVCGQTPFAHDSASACIASIAADPLPDPRTLRSDLPAEFVAVLMRALEKNANERYQTVEELVQALAPFAATDDDAEMVSAVRRAFAFQPKASCHEPTLHGLEPRAESDRTVPPAISGAVAPVKRRFRSSIGYAAVALLGLSALVIMPRCVAAGLADATPNKAAYMPEAAAMQAPSVVVMAPAPVAVPAAVEAVPVAIASADVPVMPEVVVVPTPIARAVRAKLEKPAKEAAVARSSVHGGLSNPGF